MQSDSWFLIQALKAAIYGGRQISFHGSFNHNVSDGSSGGVQL